MNKSKWTEEEVTYLTKSYFSNKRIKLIAIELNRSEMSLNKALKRFKIPSKREKNKTSKNPKLQKSFKTCQIRIKRRRHKKNRNEWVIISTVIGWMVKNSINVTPTGKRELPYKINNIPSTLGQLLLNCNRFRVSMNLPIFTVKGITDS